jgi:hypothetical protein
MLAANPDRRRDVFQQNEIAAAHVASVGLQQERLGVRRHLAHRTIVEQPAVSAIGVVPDRVGPLRLAIVRIVGRQVAAFRPCDAKYDARIGLLNRILNRRQDPIGEGDIVGKILLGLVPGISRYFSSIN